MPFKCKVTVLAILLVCFLFDFSSSRMLDNHIKNSASRTNVINFYEKNSENNSPISDSVKDQCNLTKELIQEIQAYKNTADLIFQTVLNGTFKGRTYKDLGIFVDTFGSRQAGTANLEHSIDFIMDKMKKDGVENVHGEEADIPHWVRGEEKAQMLFPRKKNLALLGLGFSVGTPKGGITAEVIVLNNFAELKSKGKEQITGKIVVFNEKFVSYGETVAYRGKGASEAAKFGAVAVMIRSITPYSLNTPHTGMQSYEANVTQIPTCAITIEDAELMARLQNMGKKIFVNLQLNDYNLPLTKSRNVVGEIKGKTKPEEVVVVSGHIDSWDVGQGAMDDGGGVFITVETLALLHHLKLRPKRTLRGILWTAEEPGLWGVQDYLHKHLAELKNFKAVFESDIGTFKPKGLDFSGKPEAACIVKQVLQLLSPVGATTLRTMPEVGSDIGYFIQKGVPGLSLNNENEKYFYYHHSEADTMTVENADELDMCTAVWAISSYVIADLSVELPR